MSSSPSSNLGNEILNGLSKAMSVLLMGNITDNELVYGLKETKDIREELKSAGALNSAAVEAYANQFDGSAVAKSLTSLSLPKNSIVQAFNIFGYQVGSGSITTETAVNYLALDAATTHNGISNVSLGLVIEHNGSYTEIEPYEAGIKTGSVSSLDSTITHTTDGVQIIEGSTVVSNVYKNNGYKIFDLSGQQVTTKDTNNKVSAIVDEISVALGFSITGSHEFFAKTLDDLLKDLPEDDLSLISKAVPFIARAKGGVLAALPAFAAAGQDYEDGNITGAEREIAEGTIGGFLGAALPTLAFAGTDGGSAPASAALSVVGYGIGSFIGYEAGPTGFSIASHIISTIESKI